MRNFLLFIIIAAVVGACDSENSLDCIQTTGPIVQLEFETPPFDKVTVWPRVQLFVKEGPEQEVVVETGENLLNEIELELVDGQLNIYDRNACNLVRDYDITKVYLTSPNLTEIRNSSGFTVSSIGKLTYPDLTLISEDPNDEGFFHTDGDFALDLDVENFRIIANGLSDFRLTGRADFAFLNVYDGDVRIDAPNFLIDRVEVFQRSTEDMIINPQLSLLGEIRGIGNIYAKNRPEILRVIEYYRGRLIFD